MRHGSLFSGIGGFDEAAQWMGWENVFHCEINPFGKKVLKYYWPNAISYDDITKTDFTIHRGRIDILSGGFPCQPFSVAGKRKGTEDSRNLWPEYYRAIREIQPVWVVGENVPGLINWSGGLVFEQVQADLEAEGYEVWPFILPACSVGAPHKRERIWFIAYSEHKRLQITQESKQFEQLFNAERNDSQTNTNAQNIGLQGECITGKIERERENRNKQPFGLSDVPDWTHFPTQSPICSRNDGLSSRLVGITFPKHRNESIKAYGNAVSPPLVLQIFKAIKQYELTLNK